MCFGFDLRVRGGGGGWAIWAISFFNWFSHLSNLVFSNGSEKGTKVDPNVLKMSIFSENLQKSLGQSSLGLWQLGDLAPDPVFDARDLNQFV